MSKVIAEIGVNHNGSIEAAFDLIRAAAKAGTDYVKFQKRDVELAVPKAQWHQKRQTPWGEMDYIDYKRRMEFQKAEFDLIAEMCKQEGIDFFASVWDIPSVEFMRGYNPPFMKVPSAKITDMALLVAVRESGIRPMISTGMSTMKEIKRAVDVFDENLIIMHSTSTYPCPLDEVNLQCIVTFQQNWPSYDIGYSGHETGLAPSVAAAALGAKYIERHITLDRTMWGSDQAASVEPRGFDRLVKDVKVVSAALGDGVKRPMPGEMEPMKRLRGVDIAANT
jgi:N-acetylneuraminate synthase